MTGAVLRPHYFGFETAIIDDETNTVIADLVHTDDQVVIAQGGRGGVERPLRHRRTPPELVENGALEKSARSFGIDC